VVATPLLPWIVSVQATASAWPEMKPSFRSQFLAGLARTEGEMAARVRLSLGARPLQGRSNRFAQTHSVDP
jgi:hypothetical protein